MCRSHTSLGPMKLEIEVGKWYNEASCFAADDRKFLLLQVCIKFPRCSYSMCSNLVLLQIRSWALVEANVAMAMFEGMILHHDWPRDSLQVRGSTISFDLDTSRVDKVTHSITIHPGCDRTCLEFLSTVHGCQPCWPMKIAMALKERAVSIIKMEAG